MARRPRVEVGTLTRSIADEARWRGLDDFPAHQEWADEVERVLSFLVSQGIFHKLLPRLRGRASERDAALSEARVGFFFYRMGFRIVGWEPEEVPNRPGDVEVKWRDTDPIFIEVKGPGWEGELTDLERHNGRKSQPKHINAEGRAIDPVERVLFALDKGLPKFAASRSNILVVDDDLFVSPLDLPHESLHARIAERLAEQRYDVVAGILLFCPTVYLGCDEVEYRTYYVPRAGASRPLPTPVAECLLAANTNPQGPRWLRDRRKDSGLVV